MAPGAVRVADAPSTIAATPKRLLRRLSRGPPRSQLSVRSWWRGLHGDDTSRSRYSLNKAVRFNQYSRTTSSCRQLAAVMLFPLLGVLAALALPLIPLQNPTLGPLKNWGSWLHIYGINWTAMASGLVHTRAVSDISHHDYSTCAIGVVATIAALPATAFYVALGFLWRFPIPFYPAFAPLPFVASLVAVHGCVFRGGRLRRDVRTKLLLYVPSLTLQVSQLTIYPTYSALFATASQWQQILLVLLYPIIKFVLRRWILAVSRHLRDFGQEIAFCGVEISASTYQATIIQSTPFVVTALIIAIDVALNVWSIKRYVDIVSIVPAAEILTRAVTVLQKPSAKPVEDHDLTQFATERTRVFPVSSRPTTPMRIEISPVSVTPDTVVSRYKSRVASGTDTDKIVVTHALELLQAAESVLLVEYLEVAVPSVNALYLVIASQLPSATYNSKLRIFHAYPSQLGPAVASIMLYTSLQAVTLIAMCVVMRVRYRLSALTLLAFVLETHAWSLYGKLVMWLVAILAIPVIHYGVDFTFKFEYTPLPAD